MSKAGVAVVALTFFAAACGGGGSSNSPTSPSGSGSSTNTGSTTTSTTTTSASTVTSGLFTFTFPAGMATADPALIQNAITTQAAYFQSVFGRTVTQPTTIIGSMTDPGCANQGSSAFTGQHTMTICVGDFGWTVHDSLNKQKILMHETFHLLQFEMRWLGHPNPDSADAHWIDEGTAEYMGWRGAANAGLVTFDTAKACMVAQANAQTSPTQNLSSLETGAGFGIPGAYQLAMLGVDELLATPGITGLMTYGTGIANDTAWPTVFQSTFGTSTGDFYAQYASYRASLGAGSSAYGT